MRRTSLIIRYVTSIAIALLTGFAVATAARAQLPSEPSAQDSEVEEAPEEPDLPGFGGPLVERLKLTGDWFGWRSGLADHGVTLDISATQYFQGVTAGGIEQAFKYGGRNDYFLNLDGEKLGLWQGVSVTLHGESRYGETANSLAGTLLAPNLLLALPQPSGSVTALTGVTITQVLSDSLEVFGGKINTLDDYLQPLTGANNLTGFQNTAMLYNPVFARTVPYSTYGAGFAVLQNEESVFSVTVFDTNDTTTVIGFDTFFDNGATVYAEWNLPTSYFGRPGHQGISGAYSSGTYTDLTPSAYLDPIAGLTIVATRISGSWCLAYNFDQALYVSPDDEERMWGAFGNFGMADSNPSPVRWFASLGISGASQIGRRKADTFGVACFYLGVSEPLKNLAPNLLPLRDEYGVEAYYNLALTPWCQIAPDLQVITPFRERANTAVLLGLRAMLDF